jgi:PDZ domain-containing protein
MTEASAPNSATPPRSHRTLGIVVGTVVALLLVLVIVASRIDLPYYALSPGDASSVGPLVTVPADHAHQVRGKVLLTDVLEARVTLLNYLPFRWSSGTDIIPAGEILGPATPPDQLAAQGYLEMAQSQSAAKAAAFTRLGYAVPEHDAGTLIFAVQPGAPASAVLKVGQIVTAVGSVPTPNTCAFVGAVHALAPGTDVTLSVEQSTVTTNAVIQPGPTVQETVRLGRQPKGAVASGCPGITGPTRAYLGIEIETQQDYTYPFRVTVDTTNIGGPSAGLAMTLAIIDKLYDGDLTGGAAVAATGTIDPEGDVGPIGGVKQKTVAVERAGARAFLVPAGQNYVTAKAAAAGSSLRIYSVATLAQALNDLEHLGGHVPPKPG